MRSERSLQLRSQLKRVVVTMKSDLDNHEEWIYAQLGIDGVNKTFMVDTGAQISVLCRPLKGKVLRSTPSGARGVTGRELDIRGEQEVKIQFGNKCVKYNFIIADIDIECDGIMGLDLLEKFEVTIDVKTKQLTSPVTKIRKIARKCKRKRANQKKYQEEGSYEECSWTVHAIKSIKIPAYSEAVVPAKIDSPEGTSVCVEPSRLPQAGLNVGRCVCTTHEGKVPLKVINLTSKPILIDNRQQLGVAGVLSKNKPRVATVHKTSKVHKVPRIDWSSKLHHLNVNEASVLRNVLIEYSDVFEETGTEGCKLQVEHKIPTGGAKPVIKRPYRVPFHLRSVIEEHIEVMLDKGVITPSISPWSAPIVLVQKKTPEGEVKYRFCTDFRGLNAVTRVDTYPLPLIQETLEQLGTSRFFTTLDLASGYHQIPISREDQEKTAFTTFAGHYEYKRMAFGLAGAPATFQRLMDDLLGSLKGLECYVYLDDVIIHSATLEEHAQRLARVLEKFRQANLKVNPDKCQLAQGKVAYLGHIVTESGVAPDPAKVSAIKEYPRPKTPKDIRAFLGLAGYYRRFIPRFAEKGKPLTKLVKADTPFVWGKEQEESFKILRSELCSKSVLIYPDFRDPFILATDASKSALGAVLSQIRDGEERPICYASRQLRAPEQNYSTTERELLAVIWATKQFRCYLLGRKFKLVTDHAALRWMLSLRDPSSRLTRWALRLEEFDYEVEHKAGRKHSNADALSRAVAAVRKVASPHFNSKAKIRRAQENDVWCQQKKDVLRLDQDGLAYWTTGITRPQDWKLAVPASMVQEVLHQCHSTPWAGHPGIDRTEKLVSQSYFWPSMKRDVEDFVRRCETCAHRKKPAGLQAPLETPYKAESPMEQISMDIVGPLPRSNSGHKYILTVVDHFTRYAEAIPLKDQTAEHVAKAFVEEIITRHGVPTRLLTDQGRNFVSSLMKEICKNLGIKKIQTTPYHPQSNGMVERLHRTLTDSLSHFVRRDGRDWHKWVKYVVMAYRSIPHSSTGYSPNYLMYGREIRAPCEYQVEPNLSNEEGEEDAMVIELQRKFREAYEEAKRRSEKAWASRTAFWNKNRRLRLFTPGQYVYLYVPAIKPGDSSKFHKPYTGPHLITQKTSNVNYELQLNNGRKVVVHVNRMKPAPRDDQEDRPDERDITGALPAPSIAEQGETDPDEEEIVWEPQDYSEDEDIPQVRADIWQTYTPRGNLPPADHTQPEVQDQAERTLEVQEEDEARPDVWRVWREPAPPVLSSEEEDDETDSIAYRVMQRRRGDRPAL